MQLIEGGIKMIGLDFHYEVQHQEIWITRYLGDDQIATIPPYIDDLPVTKICQRAFAATDAAEIHVTEGIESIESEAFALCEELNRVVLPSTLKKLGRGVFNGSAALEQIVFPNGNPSFSVDNGALYHNAERSLVLLPPGLKTQKFNVPAGIKVISSGAFYQNTSLEYVKLPVTLEKIESGSFLFTDRLKMIELPPDIKEIEPGSFLVGRGLRAEKEFNIYAFPDSVGYRYAVENQIPVQPLYAIVTDS